MRAIDTNVLVRLITIDDARQAAAAEASIAPGAWVSLLALAEAMWVLRTSYGLDAGQIAIALEKILDHQSLVVQYPSTVRAALVLFKSRPSLGFSDCLMVQIARTAGHLTFGTFDRHLAKVDGCHKL